MATHSVLTNWKSASWNLWPIGFFASQQKGYAYNRYKGEISFLNKEFNMHQSFHKFFSVSLLHCWLLAARPPVDLHWFFHFKLFSLRIWKFHFGSNLIFVCYTGSKNPVWTGKKFQLVLKSIFISVWNKCPNGYFKKPVQYGCKQVCYIIRTYVTVQT